MKRKIIALFLILALWVPMLTACGQSGETSAAPAASAEAGTPSEEAAAVAEPEPSTVTFTDSAGRVVELPSSITKISPSGGLAQMFLLAIAPDLLATISSEYPGDVLKYIPPEVAALPVVGQFYGSADLNFESIASIGPGVVIDIGEPKKTIAEDMDSITENLAIPAIHITATLKSTPDAFRTLGKLLGREEKGEELAKYCEKILAQTDTVLAQVGDNKASVLYCLGDAGTNVIAATSFHAEILDYIANNLAVVDEPSSKGSGNETDLEQISIWDPEVILFAPNSVYSTVAADPVWNKLTAIKNGRYYEVPFGPYNWMGMPPSVNRFLGMIWLTKVLYPDAATYDLYDEVAEYYRLFYSYNLTEQAYGELMKKALSASAGS